MKSIKLISQDKSHQMNSYYELDYGLFKEVILELEEKVRSKYFEDTIYTDINSISSNLASECLDKLIAANDFKSSTVIIHRKKLLYTDVRYVRLLAKKAGKLDILNCKSVNNPDGPTEEFYWEPNLEFTKFYFEMEVQFGNLYELDLEFLNKVIWLYHEFNIDQK